MIRGTAFPTTRLASEDAYHPVQPRSLFRVFVGHSLGNDQADSEDRSARADAQAVLSLHWAHTQSCRECCTTAYCN